MIWPPMVRSLAAVALKLAMRPKLGRSPCTPQA